MTIHTFGDYMEKFHRHLHAMVSDGLFRKSGVFYVMLKVDLGPLEEIFRAKVLKMLKAEGKIGDALINNLMSWKHTGFYVHNGVRIAKDEIFSGEVIRGGRIHFLKGERLKVIQFAQVYITLKKEYKKVDITKYF